MLRDAATATAGATPRVTAGASSASLSTAASLASSTHAQRAQARVTSVAEGDLFASKAEAETQAQRARAAGSLLRRLRLPGGGAAVLRELELYRVFDVAASMYHTRMTAGVPAGHLVFVPQGEHGAVSLVIVGGRREQGGDAAEEFTLLVRGC